MKKQILLFLLIINQFLFALPEMINWSQLSYQIFLSNDEQIDVVTSATPDKDYSVDTSPKSGFRWQHELAVKLSPKLQLDLKNDHFYSQKSAELRNSFHYNYARLRLSYQNNIHYASVSYANRFYNDKETRLLTLPGLERETKQRMVHNTVLYYRLKMDRLTLELSGGIRNLDYECYEAYLEEDDDDDSTREEEWQVDRIRGWDHDIYLEADLEYGITDQFYLLMKIYQKNDLNKTDAYDYDRYGLGVKFNHKFDFFNMIKASFIYFRQDFASGNSKDNCFETDFRYTKRIGGNLAGFISYNNRSCYDSELKEIFRISNLIRVIAKYSYLTGNVQDSYLLAGIKLNPENNGNAVMLELSNYLWHDIYLTAGTDFAPDLYLTVSGKLEYHLNARISFWLQDDYTDYELSTAQHIFSLGFTGYF
ncbi:MAG: hypothetical protein JW996_01260 [Candidatus Cloacimonetes bacterium]|nr:hypothetical protein [Candidatus Cloacimonadota bacterium]